MNINLNQLAKYTTASMLLPHGLRTILLQFYSTVQYQVTNSFQPSVNPFPHSEFTLHIYNSIPVACLLYYVYVLCAARSPVQSSPSSGHQQSRHILFHILSLDYYSTYQRQQQQQQLSFSPNIILYKPA